jgi:endoglucanase
MKKLFLITLGLGCMGLSLLMGQTVVSTNGLLKVSGGHVVNKNNAQISLSGNSMFWSNDGWGGEKYYNASVVGFLKNDWKSSVIRVAMGVAGSGQTGGYIDSPTSNKAKVKTVVDACIANGLYVIIDFHCHEAQNYTSQAVAFFQEMARTYGTYDNVMYEIFNEPLAVSWSGVVKPYAQTVVNAIRAIDPDNLIIVGTPNWSQNVDEAANDQIAATNIAYTLHFYAGTHFQWLRDKANTAMSKGAAIFITEWGTCDASGNGNYNEASSNEWLTWAKANGISLCNWTINDKSETASALNSGASSTGGWTSANYTTSGTYVRNKMISWGGTTPTPTCTTVTIPATIQAEAYCDQSGIQTETCSEGSSNVGWIDAGDWMSYSITVPTAGTYKVSYRVASLSGGGNLQLDKDAGATVLGTIAISSTGGWQTWSTVSHTVTLPAGTYNIGINAKAGGFNINSFTIESSGSSFYKKIEAETFNQQSGIATETTTDTGGGSNVGWIDSGDWMTWSVTIPTTATYTLNVRVASPNSTAKLRMDKDAGATVLATVTVPNTGGWQTWTTASTTVSLPAGTYNLGMNALTGGFNLNWLEITSTTKSASIETSVESVETGFSFYPNPCKEVLKVNVNDAENAIVEIYNISGQLQLRQTIQQGVSELNTTGFAKGIYLMKLNKNNRVYTEKIIKE